MPHPDKKKENQYGSLIVFLLELAGGGNRTPDLLITNQQVNDILKTFYHTYRTH